MSAQGQGGLKGWRLPCQHRQTDAVGTTSALALVWQGQTQYPHVILQLPKDTPLEVTINLEEDEIQERFGEKLSQIEAGDMPSVIAKVFSAFTKRKVIALKKDGFNGGSKAEDDRATSIRCSVKANEGQLYPLDKCFFFIANKPMVVDFDKVATT